MYSFGVSESGGGTPRFLSVNPGDKTYLSILVPELASVVGSEEVTLEDLRFCAGLKSSLRCFLDGPRLLPSTSCTRLLSVDDIMREDAGVYKECL